LTTAKKPRLLWSFWAFLYAHSPHFLLRPTVVVLDFLSLAADAVKPVEVTTGWTPSAFMGLLTNFIMGGGVVGGLKIFASHLLQMRKIADARASQIDQRADGYTDKLTIRVAELEKAVTDERRDCDRQLGEMRRDYDKELSEVRSENREMRDRLDSFMRKMVAFQSAEARVLPLTPEMAKAMDSLDRVKGVNE